MSLDDSLDELLDLMEDLDDSESSAATELREWPTFSEEFRWGDRVAGHYHFERVIYESQDKAVLLVRHRNVDRQFAMKVLPPGPSSDPEAVARLREEARATSVLGHHNIVFVTDFGHSSRVGHYYVMEYLNGETLSSRLLGGMAESLDVVLNVAACAGSALASVHELGIVHRDVRPTNLVSHRVGERESWKLLDFGRSSDVVDSDEVIGMFDSPLYVAPELAEGGEVGPAADQFSLAATLFHALFGEPPWPERTWTTSVSERWCVPVIPEPPPQLEPVADELSRVLLEALAPDPENRFAGVDDFVAAFQRASGVSREPTLAPDDVPEALRVADGDRCATTIAVDVSYSSDTSEIDPGQSSQSLEVSVADIRSVRPVFEMTFKSARRMRREWRRNIIGWSVFVPTRRRLSKGSPVTIRLDYEPTRQSASFPGRVTGRRSHPAPGLAVEIEAGHRNALHEFVSSLEVASFGPEAVVEPTDRWPDSRLGNDERFLLSKVTEPTTVGALRQLCANLPLPVDDVLGRLEEKKLLRVLGEGPQRQATPQEPQTTADDVASVLERADVLRDQGNFMAEIETLRVAAERYENPALLHRLAFARLRFKGDLQGALENLQRAVELDPTNDEYVSALESVKKFSQYGQQPDTP